MQIVHELGGIPLRSAYTLIKAISKKQQKKIDAERDRFIAGASANGLTEARARELFELILRFAGYGFNKSHSTGYAIIAYQTAYLKTYFPNQYMAAFLSYEAGAGRIGDWIGYVEDCRRTRFVGGKVGVEVRPPDINLSRADFTVVFDPGEPREAAHGHVRFGLAAIKGAGDKAIAAIVSERDAGDGGVGVPASAPRPFASIFDFCERVLTRCPGVLNKAVVESLIKAGCFDSVHGRGARAALCATVERAIAAAQKSARDRASGQAALFGLGADAGPTTHGHAGANGAASTPLAPASPWNDREALAFEKESLGFYVSSHPLDEWSAWSAAMGATRVGEIREATQRRRVLVAGVVQTVRPIVVKQGRMAGQRMGAVTVEDRTGSVECVLFTDAFARYGHLLARDAAVFLVGEIDLARGEPQVIVDRVVPIDAVPKEAVRWLDVLFDGAGLNGACEGVMERARAVLASAAEAASVSPGVDGGPARPVPLRVFVQLPGIEHPVPIPVGAGWSVAPTPALVRELTGIVGEGCLRLTGPLPGKPEDGRKEWSKVKTGGTIGGRVASGV